METWNQTWQRIIILIQLAIIFGTALGIIEPQATIPLGIW